MAATRRTTARFVLPAAFGLLMGGALGALPRARAGEPPPVAPAAGAPVAGEPRPADLVLGDEIPVTDVLKNLAKVGGCSITWSADDKAISYKKIRSDGSVARLDAAHVFDAVRALLANEEIVLVPYGPAPGRMYRAVDVRALASQFVMKMQPDPIVLSDATLPMLLGQGGRFVTATIRVTNLTELRDARTALQRLVTQNNIGSVQEVPAARAFVVTDFAPNVAVIYRAIQAMDVPPPPPPVVEATRVGPAYFVLKHARARTVAAVLRQLFPEDPAPSRPVAPGAAAAAAVPAAPARPTPRISDDEDSNQVVVIAHAEDLATIKDVVLHLDVEPAK